MAKRKRAATSTTSSRKKPKAGAHAHGKFDSQKEYKLRSIVGETTTHYLISWEDDEVTGESFVDTWEPKANANQEAVEDWERKKADKERVERQSGIPSRSRSVSSTPAAPSSRRPTTPKPRRGRPRKIVESSPAPPGDRRQSSSQQAHLQPDELLEIGESQPSQVNGNSEELPDSSAASPLFVTDHNAAEEVAQRSANVALSPPHSSWLAGAYEPISASQIPTSDPPINTQPEPSQYIPDLADTTGTTEDTTEISAVQTTPSQQARSVPVNFNATPRLVADSQSLPGSSSYIPSAEKSSSQTGSATVESIDTSSAAIPASSSRSVEQEGETQQVQAGAEGSEVISTSHEQAEISQSQFDPIVDSSEQAPPTVEELAPSQTREKNLEVIDTNASPEAAQLQVNSSAGRGEAINGPSVQLRSSAESRPVGHKDFQREHSPPQASSGALQLHEDSPTWDFSALDDPPQDTVSSAVEPTSAQPQPAVQSSSTESAINSVSKEIEILEEANHSSHPEIEHNPQTANDRGDLIKPSAASQGSTTEDEDSAGAATGHASQNFIDLTSASQEPRQSFPFKITPPERVTKSFDPSLLRQQPDSSEFFPFQTQLPRVNTSSAELPSSRSQNLESQVLPHEVHIADQSPAAAETDGPNQVAEESLPRDSSSIPHPPLQSIENGDFGDSAPPVPDALSTPIRPSPNIKMDQSSGRSGSEGGLTARIKAMRARHRASQESLPKSTPLSEAGLPSQSNEARPSADTTATPLVTVATADTPAPVLAPRLASPLLLAQDGWRSPSAVPHLEPLPVITQEEMNTSARYETLLPQAQNSGADDQRNGSLTSTGTPFNPSYGEYSENTDLYTIPISMVGSQKDHYTSQVNYHRDYIQRFLDSDSIDAELNARLKHFLDKMRRITMHMDLDNPETLTQYDVDDWHQADWDVKCSAKFRFLKDVLDALKDADVNVAIVTQPGRVIDMLETFLQGKKIAYRRLGAKTQGVSEGQDNVRTLLVDTSVDESEAGPVDLVIAMENLIRHDTALIRALRRRGNQWAPFVSLIVPRTVEHIERCLSPQMSEGEVARSLISGVYQFRTDAGRLEPGQQSSKDAALALARFLTRTDKTAPWPITPLTLLEVSDSQEGSDQNVEGTVSNVAGVKRSREPEEGVNNVADHSKRARVAPQSSAAMGDTTHISDSVENSTQSKGKGSQENSSAQRTKEERLSSLLHEAQRREAEYRQALEGLQYRQEEQRNRLLEVTRERDGAIITATNAVSRLGETSNNMSSLRAKRSELEAELKDAKVRLLEHTVPERAEFEALRVAAAQAKADKEKAEAKIIRMEKDLEYVREKYQNASNAAQGLATQNTELENQVAVLKNKATGEQVKLRDMYLDDFTNNLRNENKKLKAMMKDREAAIKFRDDEISKLKEASRGRMGTRNSSVPRTPRMGSPMKGRVGSRQSSPAAGELRTNMLHPLRNAQGS